MPLGLCFKKCQYVEKKKLEFENPYQKDSPLKLKPLEILKLDCIENPSLFFTKFIYKYYKLFLL